MPKTIDCTPTWEGILSIMLTIYRDAKPQGVKEITEEFLKMAKAADRWNAHVKAEQAKHESPANIDQ